MRPIRRRNLGFVTRRPIEVGPRLFEQDVDTWYFNLGLEGTFGCDSRFHWDVNFASSENTASQTFTNGYNIGKIRIALGDPAVCALVPGCTPLDLFGGQGRPFTQEMIDYIRTTQIDSSKQTLQLLSANLTGDLFDIGDRTAGFAVGAEHREYEGEFQPDPLRADRRIAGLVRLARRRGLRRERAVRRVQHSVARDAGRQRRRALVRLLHVRRRDHRQSSACAGSPSRRSGFAARYSTGFRAPNLGELFGLTQFAATLTDPCGPTGTVVVNDADGLNTTPLETACRAQGVPSGFEQANTQITTFTGGNADLQPEKSDSYTVGIVHNATWAEGFADRLTFELTYYSHEIDSGIQARDLAGVAQRLPRGGRHRPDAVLAVHARGQRQPRPT